MSFVAQARLADVPALRRFASVLASFHYCQECAYDGHMPWGWNDRPDNKGYDISLFEMSQESPDQLGMTAEPIIAPHTVVGFRDVVEVPKPDDLDIWYRPDDYPQGKDDFDENIYLGLVHVARAKLGGWPTWVQAPAWPPALEGTKTELIFQLDWSLCEKAPWCNGGYAYVFAKILPGQPLVGDLALLTT
jgi:hypothetical protein